MFVYLKYAVLNGKVNLLLLFKVSYSKIKIKCFGNVVFGVLYWSMSIFKYQ